MTAAVFKRMSRAGALALCSMVVLEALVTTGCRKKKPVYALVPKSIGQIYWAACEKGMQKAVQEEDVKGYFTGPPTTDVAQQRSIIENLLLQENLAGIGISPNDPTAVIEVINRAMERGIPVVTFDSDSPDSKRIAYIGTDNEGAGRVAGETLAKYMDGKGEVAILTGGLGALNLNQRIKGFRSALERYPDMKEVALRPDDDDSQKATEVAYNLLMARPNLGGFFGVSAPGAPGAARAVETAKRVGEVKIVGFDDTPECREYIEKGVVQATIAQRPFDMGYKAVKVLVAARNGKLPEKKIMDTGVIVITKANLKETEQKYE
jgi:ribose transport system substrate-binding protein